MHYARTGDVIKHKPTGFQIYTGRGNYVRYESDCGIKRNVRHCILFCEVKSHVKLGHIPLVTSHDACKMDEINIQA